MLALLDVDLMWDCSRCVFFHPQRLGAAVTSVGQRSHRNSYTVVWTHENIRYETAVGAGRDESNGIILDDPPLGASWILTHPSFQPGKVCAMLDYQGEFPESNSVFIGKLIRMAFRTTSSRSLHGLFMVSFESYLCCFWTCLWRIWRTSSKDTLPLCTCRIAPGMGLCWTRSFCTRSAGVQILQPSSCDILWHHVTRMARREHASRIRRDGSAKLVLCPHELELHTTLGRFSISFWSKPAGFAWSATFFKGVFLRSDDWTFSTCENNGSIQTRSAKGVVPCGEGFGFIYLSCSDQRNTSYCSALPCHLAMGTDSCWRVSSQVGQAAAIAFLFHAPAAAASWPNTTLLMVIDGYWWLLMVIDGLRLNKAVCALTQCAFRRRMMSSKISRLHCARSGDWQKARNTSASSSIFCFLCRLQGKLYTGR